MCAGSRRRICPATGHQSKRFSPFGEERKNHLQHPWTPVQLRATTSLPCLPVRRARVLMIMNNPPRPTFDRLPLFARYTGPPRPLWGGLGGWRGPVPVSAQHPLSDTRILLFAFFAIDLSAFSSSIRPSGINRRFFRPVSPQAKSILLLGKSIPNCPARGGFLAGVAFYYQFGLYLDPNWARPRRR